MASRRGRFLVGPNEADESVHWIDTASSSTIATIPVATDPRLSRTERVRLGCERRRRTLSRIDPRTNRVTNILVVGNRPSGIAVGANGIWVTFQAPLD